MEMDKTKEMNTICAISTPYGSGGIAVIRVSGEDAIAIVDTLFRGRKSLAEAAAYTVHYGEIVKGENGKVKGEKFEILDQVLVSVFRAPHSFTGEDVVEIACHGSMYIQQTLLQWLIDAGCQMAKAGEFTQRAFLNGKMDLTEAEAVADLIAAQTKAEKDLALSQLRGGISHSLAALRERLLTFTSLIELELDFADHEELEFADRQQLYDLAQEIDSTIQGLVNSFKTGNAIKQGIPVAIIGAPNVGKSTLLNAILGKDIARTGAISSAHHKGMHTTTFSEMYPLNNPTQPYTTLHNPTPNSWIIDTPGIKGFGMLDMERQEMGHYFREIFAISRECRYSDCVHMNEPGCAVNQAVVEGRIAFSRYESYLSMLDDITENKYR